MGKHISLILASTQTFADIIVAGQQPQNVAKLLEVIDSDIKNDPGFKEYIEEASEKLDFHAKEDFNLTTGFYATWILASYKPAWYMRNCSVSLFLQHNNANEAQWRHYTTPWPTDLLPGTKITNHFADANYSLGSLISPENARNFISDYKQNAEFKQSVDNYFGVFVWGLFDALHASAVSNTTLIESLDIFSVISPPSNGGFQFTEQNCYTTQTYNSTNVAIQAYSILAQIQGNNNHQTIDILMRNTTTYAKEVSEKVGVTLPLPSKNMWN